MSRFARLTPASLVLATLLPLASTRAGAQDAGAKPLRAGIIGLDTSHAVAFTRSLNAPEPKPELAGVRVVAAYPGGSPDIEGNTKHVEEYTRELRDVHKVEIVGSIDALLAKVDVVLLESVDGRPHLAQAEPVFRARKPVFIDKPVAGSLADAVRIGRLAERSGTPWFSSSALRYSPSIRKLAGNPAIGDVVGCDAFSPSPLEPHHPDLFWYGIHGVETLYTVMGPGCISVSRVRTDDADVVTGTWRGGRVGTFRGTRRGPHDYGALAFGAKGIVLGQGFGGYEPLLAEVVKFFRTGRPPVSAKETLEIYAFMEAADESKRRGGAAVTLESVLAHAREEVDRESR
ncbi:Oxidoreductase family, NAD-binding Rossmann fold [Aquisphaera giovannonii]|uniref:Oxidoreductase family, NAD-binding Rossmann fold n=1 Tax=Aquisphaera giovannonii TaxID=406548 RepID=A0A5B9WFS0_9BACT|nr:Gfo/Idh/MocA family oxidoreductase [Aquisphaera giovannonii]QEH39094.1 Oxidoreductase family, NAD-binding Rossmann fold [Aquisphaera giovannonii]